MAYGKAIELFLVNGMVDSFITTELSNWNGKAIKIPGRKLPHVIGTISKASAFIS